MNTKNEVTPLMVLKPSLDYFLGVLRSACPPILFINMPAFCTLALIGGFFRVEGGGRVEKATALKM